AGSTRVTRWPSRCRYSAQHTPTMPPPMTTACCDDVCGLFMRGVLFKRWWGSCGGGLVPHTRAWPLPYTGVVRGRPIRGQARSHRGNASGLRRLVRLAELGFFFVGQRQQRCPCVAYLEAGQLGAVLDLLYEPAAFQVGHGREQAAHDLLGTADIAAGERLVEGDDL